MIDLKKVIKEYEYIFVALAILFVSFLSFLYFFDGGKNLVYADAISRLNITRKIIDNITPGFAQVGNVWLPLPQILMLPFIWNNYLWHSGIAGYLMSGTSFILCGVFIYKSAKIISKSWLASIFSLGIYALNINMLYLQTTAMSESIFTCSLAATIYFFLKWFTTKKSANLILAALSISAMNLIRYEGLAILLPSIPMVFLFSYVVKKNYHRAEGTTLLFAFLACLGFGMWTIYLTAIFGDPLYWNTYYATPQATGGAGAVAAYTQAKSFPAAVWQYFTSVTWMAGIIPMIYAILGVFLLISVCIRKKSLIFMPLLLPLSIYLFMVLTLMRNTPIVQPDLTWNNIISGTTSLGTGFNIRYGLLMIPWIAIMSAFVFRVRFTAIKILLFALLFVQFHTYWAPDYTVIYKIPAAIRAKPYSQFTGWLKQNYDGGPILISAGSLEDQIFATGFDYKTFIHEGAGKYWKESLDNPSRYAKWVVIDYGNTSDTLAKNMNRADILEREYVVAYEEAQLKVYKKITDPYYKI